MGSEMCIRDRFYVQYAHARCRSVLRSAEAMFGAASVTPEALATVDLSGLSSDVELAVLHRIASFPRSVEAAAAAREPHRIATYCIDLASDFHTLWNRGREDTTLRFLHENDRETSLAKLALVSAIAGTLRCALTILGVVPVEEMR